MKKVDIYTDGACSGNPGAGGYGIVMIYNGIRKEVNKGFIKTTNNRMELMAVVDALSLLKQPCVVELYSDSKYVVDAINKGWIKGWQAKGWKNSKKEPVKNIDLWNKLIPELEKHQVKFIWVKGHADNVENERCDELARMAITDGNLIDDVGFANDASSLSSTNDEVVKESAKQETGYLQNDNKDKVVIYTDGACSGNPGAGGYGIVMMHNGERKEVNKGFVKTTNNRMELLAVIDALSLLKESSFVELYSDSKYVVSAIKEGWLIGWIAKGWKNSKKEPVKNDDLWKQLIPLLDKHQVEFIWVKGHADNVENERCDELARKAIQENKLILDKGFDK